MPDAVAYPLIGLVAAGLIAVAAVWPQGEGVMSPGPFALHHHGIAVAKPPSTSPSALRGPLPASDKSAQDRAASRPATTFP
jgi:hypothetical protein